MTKPIGWVAAVVVVVGLFIAWLHFIHDPAVRARAALNARDAAVDSMLVAFGDSVAAWQEQDRARLTVIDSLGAEVVRLTATLPPLRTVTDTLLRAVPDTALRRQFELALARERAVADSTVTILRQRVDSLDVLAAGRLALLNQARATIDSLNLLREAWRDEAGGGPLGLGCAVGPVVALDGFSPVGVSCGVTLRLR
jgi:hypothetical protein